MDKYYCGSHQLRQNKRRFPRLRHVLVFLALAIIWGAFFSLDGQETGAAQGAKAPAGKKTTAAHILNFRPKVRQQDLVHISNEEIQRHNLTIDAELQDFIVRMAARYYIQHGAVAVMDARSGDILALYGITDTGEDCTLALQNEVAASIFKIVTAAAAMEYRGYGGGTKFFYTGGAHTLYKNQLSAKRDRWGADITLAEAFARSNNVVFGKLGSIYVGENPIQETAQRLGFGRSPLRVFDSPPSVLFTPADAYEQAELACGFNQGTRISPIHAAQIITAALNQGAMFKPRLIKTEKSASTPVMQARTACELKSMMEKTVKSGTVAKHFRGTGTDRVLRHLSIGGKSGSLDGKDPVGRRNWFAGFAQDEQTGEAIAIGCVLVLNKRFHIQADVLSRLIMREYFANRGAVRDVKQAFRQTPAQVSSGS